MRNIFFSVVNSPTRRNETLDILRFVAVSLVLFRHMPNPEVIGQLHIILAYPLRILNEIGWIGVDLFFVLSGYLVSGLIFKEIKSKGEFSSARFLIRRGFKIYPSFYLLIGATLLVALGGGKEISHSQVLSEIFFYQNYVAGLWNHTWSLGVEEQFYFLVALLISFLVKAKKISYFPILCALIFIICPILRIHHAIGQDFSYIPSLTATHFRIDSLFLGSFLSYLQVFRAGKFLKNQHIFKKLWPVAAFLALLLPWWFPLTKSIFMQTFGFTILAISSAVILVGLLDAAWHLKTWKAFAFVGSCSYPIYLFHMPCKFWPKAIIQKAFGITMSPPFDILVFFFSALVLGILISCRIEQPLLKIRDRITKQ